MFYKCPFCRNEVQPDSYVDDTALKMSAAQLLTSEGSPSRRQKVKGETDMDIATLLFFLRKYAKYEMGLYVNVNTHQRYVLDTNKRVHPEGEAYESEDIIVEGVFWLPDRRRGVIRRKFIIEVEGAEERWDSITKLLQGLCKGEL